MKFIDNQSESLSLMETIQQAIDLIVQNYSSHWLISDQSDNQLQLNGNKKKLEQFEEIHEPYAHPFMELCLCLEGDCVMRMNDDFLKLRSGQGCLIPPGIIHSEMPNKEKRYKALWLAADSKWVVVHVFVRDYYQDFQVFEGDKFEYHFDLQWIMNLNHRNDTELLKTYVLQLLLYSLRNLSDMDRNNITGSWKDTVVKEIYDYVEKHQYRYIRLSDISREQCISINHLNNIFKAATGKTIMRYVEENRIDKAKRLLRESGDTIQSIASRLGYYDPYHFSKTFKKETGFSPTQYRKLSDD